MFHDFFQRPVAVSYTHLDVYKRQLLVLLEPIPFFLSNSILHMTSGYPSTACYHGFIGTVPPLSLTLTPVSYTHLDVYKRQVY